MTRAARVICFVGGMAFLLLAGVGLLWSFSSMSLAFTACNGEYSLFADLAKCRQPYIALLVVAFAATGAGITFYLCFSASSRGLGSSQGRRR